MLLYPDGFVVACGGSDMSHGLLCGCCGVS